MSPTRSLDVTQWPQPVSLRYYLGGLGWRKEDYGYACEVLKLERCEFKSV